MNWKFDDSLSLFSGTGTESLLASGMHGLEREALRINRDGTLALTPHPKALGSSLNNPEITTDFSESQLELISAPNESIEGTLMSLERIHRFVVERLGNEQLWPFSMPCILPEEDQIPIAQYGDSEEAETKETYRRGLALRYGKKMQMLCGVHYNFNFHPDTLERLREEYAPESDFQDFLNDTYLHLLRNFARHRWLLIYLFGASPSFHESYRCKVANQHKDEALALRMSKCGYENSAKVDIDYNNFEDYLASLEKATQTVNPAFTELGLEKDGIRIQLNDHILQIANEYYFPIRLKPGGSKDFLTGLKEDGVKYVEVRLFDINPFEAVGVSAKQLYFTQVFLTYCLLSESPYLNPDELCLSTSRQQEVAFKGRSNVLPIEEWSEPLFESMKQVAEVMGPKYIDIVESYERMVKEPSHLPAHQIMKGVDSSNFIHFGLELSQKHKAKLSKDT